MRREEATYSNFRSGDKSGIDGAERTSGTGIADAAGRIGSDVTCARAV